jgi:hypothetical protein
MDVDRNGVPCETVYPRHDISQYWNGRELPGVTAPVGLLCRDLVARGFDYAEAVAYWWIMGLPTRMDVDKNGIPCETVYPPTVRFSHWGWPAERVSFLGQRCGEWGVSRQRRGVLTL